MKKRIIALMCAVVMTLGMSTTAMAAELSPQAQALIAARAALDVDNRGVVGDAVAPGDTGLIIKDSGEKFQVEVLEAMQEFQGKDIDIVGIKSILNPKPEKVPVALKVEGLKASDKVNVLAYNKAINNWEFVKAVSADGMLYTAFTGHSHFVVYINGVIPEANRLTAPVADKNAIVTILEENTALTSTVPQNTEVNLTASDLVAPRTGEFNMTVVMMLAVACLASVVVFGRKLKATR